MTMTTEIRNGTDEYKELVPSEIQEKIDRLTVIDTMIMRSALEQKFFPVQELQRLLLEVTALHSYFAGLSYTWGAIKENREVEEYLKIKQGMVGTGEKFVSASAEREAAFHIRSVNYLASVYEGNLERCLGYVNSIKKLLETLQQEEKTA